MPNDPLANALRRKVAAYTAAGMHELAEKCAAKLAAIEDAASEPAPEPEPEPDERGDGVHATGGGWYELVVDGAVVDKVRGAEAAEDTYEELTEDD